MTYYIRDNNMFRIASSDAIDLKEKLPIDNYIVRQDPFENFYLEVVPAFEPVGKLYGNVESQVSRIMTTFAERSVSTGILLSGTKGSGKTLLAKTLSINVQQCGIPTLLVNQPFCGNKFNKLIQDIEQECLIIFDEFEKVYHDIEHQDQILTLLDGTFPTKKLFVFTVNTKWAISENMINRPGRVYYAIDYRGLERDFIVEYCHDRLDNIDYINDVCTIASTFVAFNFDMLQALVEESNRYKESPLASMAMLNATIDRDNDDTFDIVLYKGNNLVLNSLGNKTEWHGNPLDNRHSINLYAHLDQKAKEQDNETHLNFSYVNLVEIDPAKGTFVFYNKANDVKLVLTRQPTKIFDYRAL